MINVIFLTNQQRAIDYLNKGKKIYPEDMLQKNNETCSITLIAKNGNVNDLIQRIHQIINNSTGIIAITDDHHYDEAFSRIGTSIVITALGDIQGNCKNDGETKQHLEDKITTSLKTIFWVKNQMNSGFGDLLRLPKRNFNSSDLNDVFDLIKKGDVPNNINFIQSMISNLKKQIRKPKRRPQSQEKYYVDDKDFYFHAGKERHSRHETSSAKGHVTECDISARFRFGVKVDAELHFNVFRGDTKNSSIVGIFDGCHNQKIHKTKTTHLNMFCNDYIA